MLAACVGDRDAHGVGRHVEREGDLEVAALDTAVQYRVGGEFGDDLFGAFGYGG